MSAAAAVAIMFITQWFLFYMFPGKSAATATSMPDNISTETEKHDGKIQQLLLVLLVFI